MPSASKNSSQYICATERVSSMPRLYENCHSATPANLSTATVIRRKITEKKSSLSIDVHYIANNKRIFLCEKCWSPYFMEKPRILIFTRFPVFLLHINQKLFFFLWWYSSSVFRRLYYSIFCCLNCKRKY